MQFSELSELTNIIVLMRSGGAGGSPRFHDRHDSEIDRMYNNSPPDDDSNINVEDPVPLVAPLPPPVEKLPNGMENGAARQQESQPTVRNKGGTKIVVFDKTLVTKKDTPSDFTFTKEQTVERKAKSQIGELSRILKKGRVVPGAPTAHDADMPMINLTIYLPDRSKMSVEVYDIVTVEEAIEAILRVRKAEKKLPVLYYGHPECYELRLHEGDGYPDDDFPALDRQRKIKNFGDADGHTYCLCERPDMCPPKETGSNPAHGTARPVSEEKKKTMPQVRSSRNLALNSNKAGGTYLLKIILPNDNYTVVPVNANMTCNDLFPILAKKQNFRTYTNEYVFRLTEEDQERLKRSSAELELDANIMQLGVEELRLAAKTYADTPQLDKDKQASEPANAASAEATFDVDQFMFNDVTGARYQEWTVIKTNKYGIRQSRIMGVDSTRIYSKRPITDKTMKRIAGVKRSERLIADVVEIKILDSISPPGCCFRITFKESTDVSVVDYEAEKPSERAEIVAKIKYNLQRIARQGGK